MYVYIDIYIWIYANVRICIYIYIYTYILRKLRAFCQKASLVQPVSLKGNKCEFIAK